MESQEAMFIGKENLQSPETHDLARTEYLNGGRRGFEIVLGGGGIKGFGHIGLLKSLAEREIKTDHFTGISIGSLIATFYVNGFKPDEITDLLCDELNSLIERTQLEDLNSDWRKWVTASGKILSPYKVLWDFQNILQVIIKKYHLRPKENLRIVASNLFNGKAVIFEGNNYDLLSAMAASCAFPLVMKPIVVERAAESSNLFPKHKIPAELSKRLMKVWELKILEKPTEISERLAKTLLTSRVLIDGGIHHPHPGHFCKGPAIVSKLGFARRLPSEPISPAEFLAHLLEVIGGSALDFYYRDPVNHIVVPVGMPDVGILSFALPKSKCEAMVAYGHSQTQRILDRALQSGQSVA